MKNNTECELRERISRLEEKIMASERALELARDSLSKSQMGAVITIILAVIAIAIHWIK